MAPDKNNKAIRPVKSPVRGIISGLYTHHRPTQCYHQLEGKPIHRQPEKATEGKEIVKIVAHDGIRELVVPAKDPVVHPAIWPTHEMARLKNQAHVVTRADRMAMMEEAERKKNQLQIESEQRKKALIRAQQEIKSKAGTKLGEVEEAEKRRAEHLLKRAYEIRQDQQEEVKRANRLILATKCHAIRDAQVAEKALVKKELDEEDLRLQQMMKEINKGQYREEKRKEEIEHEKRKKFVQAILLQVKENEVQRLYEAERKEEEARAITKSLIQMQIEEREAAKQKFEQQKKVREELDKFNEEIKHFRKIEQEEARIADLRVREFMRKKAEREQAFEGEKLLQAEAKEREIARIRESQKRQADLQAQTDELNALRIQEEENRKWRESEREKARKKAEMNRKLKEEREKQIDDLRKIQALEISRDESEFNKVVQVQKSLHEKELAARAKKREGAMKHRKEILKQVATKEQQRIEERKKKFEEGLALRSEDEARTRSVNEVITKKVVELRENKVPEQYVKDVARQLNVEI